MARVFFAVPIGGVLLSKRGTNSVLEVVGSFLRL